MKDNIRERLSGEPLEAVRATASAALRVEVLDALSTAEYPEAEALLGAYAEEATGTGNEIALGLARMTLAEVEGRYADALAALGEVVRLVPEGRPGLVADLALVAAVIEARMAEGAQGQRGAEHQAAAHAEGDEALPRAFALGAAYPNPFNPRTVIPLSLPETAHVEVTVYDVLGRRVALLADARYEAGRHTVRLDGSRLASGAYFVRAVMEPEAGEARVFTGRLTLLK